MRKCSKCSIEKENSEFCLDKSAKDKLKSWCKQCSNDSKKKYREANKIKSISIPESKICLRCKMKKFSSEFYFRSNEHDHLAPFCKECDSNRYVKYKQTPRGKFSSYKGDAKFREIEFLLSFEEFERLINLSCVYCGEDISGGVDRIDSEKGYINKNCQPCCNMCNIMKRHHTEQRFLEQVEKIYKRKFTMSYYPDGCFCDQAIELTDLLQRVVATPKTLNHLMLDEKLIQEIKETIKKYEVAQQEYSDDDEYSQDVEDEDDE